jgi:hypothetical protein
VDKHNLSQLHPKQRNNIGIHKEILQVIIIFNHFLGVTNIDFIVLPARARISVVYDGETTGEGFFGLKRL